MDKLYLKIEGVVITWRGELESKDRKTGEIKKRDAAQGFTERSGSGQHVNYDFGGVPDQIKSLKVGERVGLDVAIKPFNDQLYVDVLRVNRGGSDVPLHTGTVAGKRAA